VSAFDRIPHCPVCGRCAIVTETRYGERCYCPAHPEDAHWSWGRKPLANKRTHDARKRAHAVFDGVWKSKLTSRSYAYKLLAELLDLAPADCHMATMDAETAERVPDAVRQIKMFLERVPQTVVCERRSYPTRPTY
jgi:hypothetical protein